MKALLELLQKRFNQNMHRHANTNWQTVEDKLHAHKNHLDVLQKMEDTGGEPDVLEYDGKLYIVDFSKESPKGRRSYCYDEKALYERKKFKPESSVEKVVKDIGVEVVDEAMYIFMQTVEDLDLKTSSWLKTPNDFRKLGGALNGEKRYQRTFIFHNGADSYYGSRGFRGYIQL